MSYNVLIGYSLGRTRKKSDTKNHQEFVWKIFHKSK